MLKLFKKPNIEPKEQLLELGKLIYEKRREYENLEATFEAKRLHLVEKHGADILEKAKTIADLDNSIALKRKERAELDRPLVEKMKELNLREIALIEKENWWRDEIERVENREREADKKIESCQDLSDDFHGKMDSLNRREKSIATKEQALKQREDDYFVKVEKCDDLMEEENTQLSIRQDKADLKEQELKAKEENLANREKQLLQDKLLVQSQRQALMLAKKHDTKVNIGK